MAKIAVMGYGVVGSGVVEVLHKNHDSIAKKAKEEISVKYILDLRDFPEDPNRDLFIKDFSIIENDPEVEVVVECIGGQNPAYVFVKRSLLAGKNVATSNKELIATRGAELLKTARDKGVNLLFEASVGGGVPIIRPLHQCLAANEVCEIAGIVNGTTNFILSKMKNENMAFDDALKLAQDLGYAEKIDPSADIDGHDSCRKICILSSLAFGSHIYPDMVYTRGIRDITPTDITCAESNNYAVKLIAKTKRLPDGAVSAAVTPALVSHDSQLAGVEDVFNAILVRGDVLGDVVFYGRGAGKLPTASAVVADVIDLVQNRGTYKGLFWNDVDRENFHPFSEENVRCYVRFSGQNPFPDATALGGRLPEGQQAVITPELPFGEVESRLKQAKSQGTQVHNMMPVLDY